jgi:hypothetical protein
MPVIGHFVRVIFSCVRGDCFGFAEIFDLLDFLYFAIIFPLMFDNTDYCDWKLAHYLLEKGNRLYGVAGASIFTG